MHGAGACRHAKENKYQYGLEMFSDEHNDKMCAHITQVVSMFKLTIVVTLFHPIAIQRSDNQLGFNKR